MKGILASYRELARNRALVRLLAGEFVSSIGDWLYLVALLVVVYARSESALLLGLVGAARILPYVVLSVPAGRPLPPGAGGDRCAAAVPFPVGRQRP